MLMMATNKKAAIKMNPGFSCRLMSNKYSVPNSTKTDIINKMINRGFIKQVDE
jgi:hypothetical protein